MHPTHRTSSLFSLDQSDALFRYGRRSVWTPVCPSVGVRMCVLVRRDGSGPAGIECVRGDMVRARYERVHTLGVCVCVRGEQRRGDDDAAPPLLCALTRFPGGVIGLRHSRTALTHTLFSCAHKAHVGDGRGGEGGKYATHAHAQHK